MKKKYTFVQVEASLCVWEWMLERFMRGGLDDVEDVGSATLREWALELGPYVNRVYRAMDREIADSVPFDWEIVPAIMARITFAYEGYKAPSFKIMAREVEKAIASL